MTRRPSKPPEDIESSKISAEQQIFAANLKRIRAGKGLTQVQLAEASGISQSHISHLEKGTWEPRLVTIVALCRALRITPTDLFPTIEGTSNR